MRFSVFFFQSELKLTADRRQAEERDSQGESSDESTDLDDEDDIDVSLIAYQIEGCSLRNVTPRMKRYAIIEIELLAW